MSRKKLLTTAEAIRYVGVTKKTFIKHRDELGIEPQDRKQLASNHPTDLYNVDDLETIRKKVTPFRKVNTPEEDEKTEYGSTIHWSEKYRVNKPIKRSPNRKLEYVPITCACGKKQDIYTYEFRRKGQPRLPLCRFCSVAVTRQVGETHTRWTGGTRINQGGYREIHRYRLSKSEYKKFKPMFNSANYVSEHRLVMAQHLDRVLSRDEHVHHINGEKLDNSIENLQLVSPSTHNQVELVTARKRLKKANQEIKRLKKLLKDNGIAYTAL